ncbi:MAG: hypothetical protein J5860_04975 [Clostridia bacterium]|nr:hypothetical protein [Clostridia bacterium]
MKRRFFVILLCAATLLVLVCGCGKAETDGTQNSSQETAQTTLNKDLREGDQTTAGEPAEESTPAEGYPVNDNKSPVHPLYYSVKEDFPEYFYLWPTMYLGITISDERARYDVYGDVSIKTEKSQYGVDAEAIQAEVFFPSSGYRDDVQQVGYFKSLGLEKLIDGEWTPVAFKGNSESYYDVFYENYRYYNLTSIPSEGRTFKMELKTECLYEPLSAGSYRVILFLDDVTCRYAEFECAGTEIIATEDTTFDVTPYETDDIKIIPIYGTYLENTNSFLCMFFEDGEFIGAKSLSYDEITKAVDLSKYKIDFRNNKPLAVDALSDRNAYSMLKTCMGLFPDFEIVGVVYNTLGYQTTYPIGIQKGEDTMKYYAGELLNFRLVDPFRTAQEGAVLFEEYLDRKSEIKAQIPIYKWKTEHFYDDGYINPFQNSSARFNQGVDAYAYLDDYDDIIAVPLIDEDGREDRYALHLLYYHNNLLAELIIEYLPNEKVRLCAVYENVAEKDEATGEYDYLEKSEYQRVYEEYVAAHPGAKIKAIAFDGEQYVIIEKQ